MSREMLDKLIDAGINPDRVLQTTTKGIMGKFNERFHPADSIGYACGIHHDTHNLHIHVALCPRTARGAYVGCSSRSMNEDPKRRRGPDGEGDGDHRTVVMDELGVSARTKQGE